MYWQHVFITFWNLYMFPSHSPSWYELWNRFWVHSYRLQIATLSFVMSLCPFVSLSLFVQIYQLGSHSTDLCNIWYYSLYKNLLRKFKFGCNWQKYGALYMKTSSSSVALQPGVGLGLLYNMPPGLSIPCSVSPFVYSHLSQVCEHVIQPSHFWSFSSSCCIQLSVQHYMKTYIRLYCWQRY